MLWRYTIPAATIITLLGVPAGAEPTAYAIIVGNNSPPRENHNLSDLRYADDDAIRYYRFFNRLTDDIHLLTVPDTATQKRYPNVAARAKPPTIKHLKAAVASIVKQIRLSEARGEETVVYLAFSGHGDHTEGGEPFLSFLDGPVTGTTLYNEVLAKLEADYVHVFIDACYAKGVIGFRGPFDKEYDGERVAITDNEMKAAFGQLKSNVYPGLGVIISSSKNDKAHEWSKIESGVFTHEILSGLSGPADINLDGKIEYSELVAFVSSANLEITDPRGKLEVIARPPKRNYNAPIVNLSSLKSVAFLYGNPSSLGHFAIELKNGERYLDANLSDVDEAHIAIPRDEPAFLYTGNQEAEIRTENAELIEMDQLRFGTRTIVHRGGIESALQDGLFAATFGKSFYQGFVESRELVGVRFDAPKMVFADHGPTYAPYRKPLAITSFVVAGGAAIAAAVLGGLALRERGRFNDTYIESDAYDLNEKYVGYSNAFWITAAVVPVGVLAGVLFWPKQGKKKTSLQLTSRLGADLSLSLTF
jgi:hypothetical protein